MSSMHLLLYVLCLGVGPVSAQDTSGANTSTAHSVGPQADTGVLGLNDPHKLVINSESTRMHVAPTGSSCESEYVLAHLAVLEDRLDRTVTAVKTRIDGTGTQLKERTERISKSNNVSAQATSGVNTSTASPAGPEADSEVLDLNEPHQVVIHTGSTRIQMAPAGHQWESEYVLARLAALEDRLDKSGYASRSELAAMETRINAQLLELADNVSKAGKGGSVYVRWGGHTCPQSAETLYSGVIGGSYYNHPGAAANALCLPLNPVYDGHPLPQWGPTHLYGAEYEVNPESKNDQDPLCSVCVSLRPHTVMIPGTSVCHPGWTVEYTGYIMAGYYNYAGASEFICMDSALDARVGSHVNHNGNLFYYTVSKCGSLPCPPYEDNKIITCVVCSK